MIDSIIGILIIIIATGSGWEPWPADTLFRAPANGGHFYAEIELIQHTPPAKWAAFVVVDGMRRCISPENIKAVDWVTGRAVEIAIEDTGDGDARRWSIVPVHQPPVMRAAIGIDFINKCGIA